MNQRIRLAAIHSKLCNVPVQANPFSKGFKIEEAKKYVKKNLNRLCCFLNQAGKQGVDIVCTHEDIKGEGVYAQYLDDPGILSAIAEEIPGPTSDKIGELSKQYNMYTLANYIEKEADKYYNTSVLIGPSGELSGKYRKVHLPVSERWMLTPGIEFPVFNTEFGKLGVTVCYDIIFPESVRILSLNGADIVFHLTLGWGFGNENVGEALIRTRAHENSVYIVVAKNCLEEGNGKSCIVQNNGDILVESTVAEETVIVREIQLDPDRMQDENCFSSFLSGVNSLRGRRVMERRPEAYSALINPSPAVMERYSHMALSDTPDKIDAVYNQLKDYKKAKLGEKNTSIRPLFW